jgi:hypothetical protein
MTSPVYFPDDQQLAEASQPDPARSRANTRLAEGRGPVARRRWLGNEPPPKTKALPAKAHGGRAKKGGRARNQFPSLQVLPAPQLDAVTAATTLAAGSAV